ncbi:MAG: hypothetical protein ACRD3M_17140 [Thermoanaerobaculia bacterium]
MRRCVLLPVILLAAAAAALSCRERGRPDPDVQMAISHQPEGAPQAASGAEGEAPRIPNRLEVPEAVRQAYSGVVLLWQDASNGQEGKLEVPLGGEARIPGSELTISADVFLPAFTMTAEVITSAGIEPENPAARIRVTEKGKDLHQGWIFKSFPDVHPFTHPRFSLRLDGGVRKSSA